MSRKIPSNDDRQLGMYRAITRRDFVNGVGVALSGAMFAGSMGSAFGETGSAPPLDPYPPRRTGMRGSHPGSFEVAHQVRDTHQWELSAAIDTKESYDLVVVGGGLKRIVRRALLSQAHGRRCPCPDTRQPR